VILQEIFLKCCSVVSNHLSSRDRQIKIYLDKSEAVLLEPLKNCLQEEDGSLSGGCVGFNALKRMASEFLCKIRREQRAKYLSFLFYHFFFFAAKNRDDNNNSGISQLVIEHNLFYRNE
jgi:hypothetical protein